MEPLILVSWTATDVNGAPIGFGIARDRSHAYADAWAAIAKYNELVGIRDFNGAADYLVALAVMS